MLTHRRIRNSAPARVLVLVLAALACLPFAAEGQTARDSTLARAIRFDADSTLSHLLRLCRTGQGGRDPYVCVDTSRQKRIIARTDSILNQTTIPPVPVVATVTVAVSPSSVTAGQTSQAAAVVRNQFGAVMTGQSVAWSSSAPSVAMVNPSGLVTAVTPGGATIVGTTSGKSGSAPISVAAQTPVVTSVTVGIAASTLTVGQTTQVVAIVRDQNGTAMTGQTITWTSSALTVASVNPSGIVTATGAGSVAIVGSAGGKAGSASLTVNAVGPVDTTFAPAELPRSTVNTTYPTMTGVVRAVPAGGDLQAAMNATNPGDVIELAQGATYSGNFTWPAKACTNYTVIRTAGPDTDFPAVGARITPRYAPKLARIITPNVSTALLLTNGACKLWLSRVEITLTAQSPDVNYNYGLVRCGADETVLSAIPHDFVLDRVYVHGGANLSVQHGVLLNCVGAALVGSWVSEIHWPGVETHAIGGWAGPGPFKIENNYLEAAGVNLLFGGAYPTITGVIPADIEVRGNHFFKPTSYFGAGFSVKNLLEFKHGKRVLVENNVFENSWADAQIGYAINMFSGGDSAPVPTAFTGDVTFRYNIVRNAQLAFNLPANPYQSATPVSRVSIENNLFENIGPFGPSDNSAKGFQLLDNLSNVRVVHNTLIRRTEDTGSPFIFSRDGSTPFASRIVLSDNIMGSGQPYGAFFGSGGYVGKLALDQWASPTGWKADHNVFWGAAEAPPDSRTVPGNFWPANQAAVGFNADWSLAATSPYKGKASDGTDPGADIPTLRARTLGVVVTP